jgi:ABC-type nitrate/sulfonate/bicarbonate transport system substrate-binding protein
MKGLARNKQRLVFGMALSLMLTVLFLGGCNPPPADNNLKKVSLLIDWKAEPTYAGFYIAKERGFYQKRGLDVTVVEGSGATISATVIGDGGTYFIGSCSGEAAAIARSKQIPVRSVAVYYHDVPTVLYSRADTPIRQPSDMIGKRIGIIDGSITVDEYRGILVANNIDRAKIREVGAGFDVAPLLAKKVDGLMNYQELTPVQLRLQGHDIVEMRFADYGLKAYSLNLIVNDAALQREGDAIRKIVEATNEAYEFIRSNPDEAASIFSKTFPEKDPNYVRESLKIVAKLLGDGLVGQQTRQGWAATIATLKSLGLVQGDLKVEDVAAEGYLSNINE